MSMLKYRVLSEIVSYILV